jgi:hypothetical protein
MKFCGKLPSLAFHPQKSNFGEGMRVGKSSKVLHLGYLAQKVAESEGRFGRTHLRPS